MFAMICTDNLRYKKTKYYDSEYVIKGTLHINEHAYPVLLCSSAAVERWDREGVERQERS